MILLENWTSCRESSLARLVNGSELNCWCLGPSDSLQMWELSAGPGPGALNGWVAIFTLSLAAVPAQGETYQVGGQDWGLGSNHDEEPKKMHSGELKLLPNFV